jgi:hypothetical protein
MRWYLGRPFVTAPWNRNPPTIGETISLVVLGALFLSALQPYRQFAREHGWLSMSGKLVHDVVQDSEAAYRDGRNHIIRKEFQQ